jgi:two-component system cell cycle response regulator DivK
MILELLEPKRQPVPIRTILTPPRRFTRGYNILQTKEGLEAIDLAVVNLPDLILMDIQLPDMSGLEVTRLLRRDERSRRIPIIAVTAFAMGWHEREALDSGCDAYISKPISIFGFLRTVDSFL